MRQPTAPEPPERRLPRDFHADDVDTVGEHLWLKLVEAIRPLRVRENGESHLHRIVQQGAERMLRERRGKNDLAVAEKAIADLVLLLKHHAAVLGQPKWLGEDTIESAAADLLAQKEPFELWPFWPW
jgi:hypothetical protein